MAADAVGLGVGDGVIVTTGVCVGTMDGEGAAELTVCDGVGCKEGRIDSLGEGEGGIEIIDVIVGSGEGLSATIASFLHEVNIKLNMNKITIDAVFNNFIFIILFPLK